MSGWPDASCTVLILFAGYFASWLLTKGSKRGFSFSLGLWSRGDIKEILPFGRKWANEILSGSSFPPSKVKLKRSQAQKGFISGNTRRTFVMELCLLLQPHFHSSLPTPSISLNTHTHTHTHTHPYTFRSKKVRGSTFSFSSLLFNSSHLSHLVQISWSPGFFPGFPILSRPPPASLMLLITWGTGIYQSFLLDQKVFEGRILSLYSQLVQGQGAISVDEDDGIHISDIPCVCRGDIWPWPFGDRGCVMDALEEAGMKPQGFTYITHLRKAVLIDF